MLSYICRLHLVSNITVLHPCSLTVFLQACSITPSAPTTLEAELELNCLILGDPSNRIFSVKIEAKESVGSLKRAIKEEKKQRFSYVDADTLDLWTVSVSDIRSLDEVDSPKVTPLLPTSKLWRVFSNVPEEEHLHILVKPPTVVKCPQCQVPRYIADDITFIMRHFRSTSFLNLRTSPWQAIS